MKLNLFSHIDQLSLDIDSEKSKRKAISGGKPKWINLPRNWITQGVRYMDHGEQIFRACVEAIEIIVLWLLLYGVMDDIVISFGFSITIVHTWNWVANGLFWSVVIFTFPHLKNPGAKNTVAYVNDLRRRLVKRDCITAVAIYGSVTRGAWHDRSDIDIRFLRSHGFRSWLCAGMVTMCERYRAFSAKQPIDLFLADDVEFLMKMRVDEKPLFVIHRDERLDKLYPKRKGREIEIDDLIK